MNDKPTSILPRVVGGGVIVILLAAGGVAAATLRNRMHAGTTTTAPSEGAGAAAAAVRTVRPRLDPMFEVVASNPAYVNAYYRVDLMAQVPGVVNKSFTKDIGDPVKTGEVVLQLDAPDLAADLKVKEAMIAEKNDEKAMAEKRTELAKAAVATAQAAAKEMRQNVVIADADAVFHETRARRFEGLVNDQAAIKDTAEEMVAESKKAAASAVGSRFSVERAQAEIAEASAKLETATVDIKLKQSEIEQAKADRDKVQALIDFAALKAPFDGVVVRRMVDPGSLVSNSSTGHSDALLTLERTDILTIYANFPDVYAPYITKGTAVQLDMSELPGVTIGGKITRFAPTLQNPTGDRTMRVEVDLYNGTTEEYGQFLKTAGKTRDGLKGGELPLYPNVTTSDTAPAHVRLMPGMFGTMKLVLNEFKNAYLLPSSAVFSRGGVRYIFLVKDNKVALTRVEVQVEQVEGGQTPGRGIESKVLVIEDRDGHEVRRELRKDDVIVTSNQAELHDGQEVRPVPAE